MRDRRDMILKEHPCFGNEAHFLYGRLHLPVAPRCNISCRYCDRRYDCVNESRPGVTSKVMSPSEALERAEEVFANFPSMKVAGIAGPGEPLFNEETFETMSLLKENLPGVILCLSSNGLLVPERLEDLKRIGIDTLTVTMNAFTDAAALQIYNDVYSGADGADRAERIGAFLEKQKKGIRDACGEGIAVKINTVLIPGINGGEIEDIASFARSAGASIMNVMPLIPCGRMSGAEAPSSAELSEARKTAAKYLRQLTVCSQCRADACGIPGKGDCGAQAL